MSKYLRLLTTIFFLGIITTGSVSADTSSDVYVNGHNSNSGWTNISNVLNASDTVKAVYGTPGTGGLQVKFPTASIPTGSTINSVAITLRWHGSGQYDMAVVNASTWTDQCGTTTGTFSPSNNSTLHDTSDSFTTAQCAYATVANLNSGNFGLRFVRNIGTQTYSIDSIKMVVTYTPPQASLNITNLVASQSAGFVTFTASGDTTYTQVGEQCKIDLYEVDTSYSPAPKLLTSSVATILLDADNPRTTTGYSGNNTYLGYGFTSTISTWAADGIKVPYFNAANVAITSYVRCWHQDTNADGSLSDPIYDVRSQGLTTTGDGWNPSLIASPSALQNAPVMKQPECVSTDWVCSVKEWLFVSLNTIFGINTSFATDYYIALKTSANSKVPFAYINSALATNFSATGTSSATPNMIISFADPGNDMVADLPAISWSDSGSENIVSGFAGTFKTLVTIILWFGFLWYLVARIRHVLPQ